MIDTIVLCVPVTSITQDQYDKKAFELKDEQESLQDRRNKFFNASIDYGKLITDLISITSRAWEIFEGSRIDRKRQLLGMLFSNLSVENKKLSVVLRSPFDTIYELNKSGKWGQWLDAFWNFINNNHSIRLN